MEAFFRFVSGLTTALVGLFAPIAPLIGCTLLFIGIDFLSGIAADRHEARQQGRTWYFESHLARRTVTKAALCIIALAMAWLLDACVLGFMQLRIAHLFAGFACGIELWSFLENAAQLSDAPLFRWLRRYVRRRIRKEVGDE
ncbi:MAG: phage holin family protein [Alistipes sp.]|nr:phage holin family protein [Alistipes sp.]MBQ3082985.1 phage holin family protein [Alistipes sp.]MBQ8471419.1 phage holin family protein [Alistipes sp.]